MGDNYFLVKSLAMCDKGGKEEHPMLIYSELATPVEKVDLEPADALDGVVCIRRPAAPPYYHVWLRIDDHSLPALFAKPLPLREYRGMVSATDLVWLLFPGRK
jgi:hypothetical protein